MLSHNFPWGEWRFTSWIIQKLFYLGDFCPPYVLTQAIFCENGRLPKHFQLKNTTVPSWFQTFPIFFITFYIFCGVLVTILWLEVISLQNHGKCSAFTRISTAKHQVKIKPADGFTMAYTNNEPLSLHFLRSLQSISPGGFFLEVFLRVKSHGISQNNQLRWITLQSLV